jgi:hypothetical protein
MEHTMTTHITQDFIMEHQALIAVAEACHRGSYSWHVFEWMAWKLRCKYPLVRIDDQIVNWDTPS